MAPAAPAASGPAAAAPAEDPFSPAERDAYARITSLFNQYGLGSLAPLVLQYAQAGYGDDTIQLMLQDTPEYRARFSANDARRKAGLRVLSPGEYLAAEASYRSILSAAGLPAGFYDSPDDFNNWIANDVSPQEIQGRVDFAQKYIANTDPAVKQALQTYYGIGENDLVAYALDRQRGLSVLEKQARAVEIGAAAQHQGLSIAVDRAELFGDMGAADNADAAFAQIAQVLPDAARLSSIYGDQYTQADAEDEFLGGTASARRKREQLANKEAANFSGSSGVTKQSLGKSTAGSY